MDQERAAGIGTRAMLAGKRVVVPGVMNKLMIVMTKFLPRSFVARMAKLSLQGSGRDKAK